MQEAVEQRPHNSLSLDDGRLAGFGQLDQRLPFVGIILAYRNQTGLRQLRHAFRHGGLANVDCPGQLSHGEVRFALKEGQYGVKSGHHKGSGLFGKLAGVGLKLLGQTLEEATEESIRVLRKNINMGSPIII
ncbi:hypothetical protein [Sodalis glossinidius]|uniref:hypothetical protein n=1 Tax=Sodalis glossinidius TaxID=63612 RepID=UPI00032186E3|nr:hypothetical protein [Sodalis glossinidius]